MQVHKLPQLEQQRSSRAKDRRAHTILAVSASAGLLGLCCAALLPAGSPLVSRPEPASYGVPKAFAPADHGSGAMMSRATEEGAGSKAIAAAPVPDGRAALRAGPHIVAQLQSDEAFPVPVSEPTSPIKTAAAQPLEVGSIAISQAAQVRRDETAGRHRAAAVAAAKPHSAMRNALTRPKVKRREQIRRREPTPVRTAEAPRSDNNTLPSVLRLAD
jgi:hypothetical protein